MDHNAVDPMKEKKKTKAEALQEIFDDNTTGRPQHPDGQGQ